MRTIATLCHVDLTRSELEAAAHQGADLTGLDACGGYLRGADLRGARLSGADFRGADLRGADLRGADLTLTSWRGARMDGARIAGSGRMCSDLSVAIDTPPTARFHTSVDHESHVGRVLSRERPDVILLELDLSRYIAPDVGRPAEHRCLAELYCRLMWDIGPDAIELCRGGTPHDDIVHWEAAGVSDDWPPADYM